MRRTEVERRIVEIGQSVSYSGECEAGFRVRLLAVNGLLKIFKFHPKFNPSNSYEEKITCFSTHSDYNSALWPTLKKLDLLPFVPYAFTIKVSLTYG